MSAKEQKSYWAYHNDNVYAGGGAKCAPQQRGFLVLTYGGISIEPDDGYYDGDLNREHSIELAVAVLELFAPEKLK